MVSGQAIATIVVFIVSIIFVIYPYSFVLPLPRFLPYVGGRRPRIHINLTTAPIIAILVLWAAQCLGPTQIRDGIVGTDNVKPYNILILFFSLAYMAITLDITGILQAAAFWVSNKGGNAGWKLFLYFYIMLTVLSVVLGNDPVILSGTAFLVYYTNVNNLNPDAWLISEFAAANTASMVLFLGNPTNVVICEGFRVNNAAFTAYTILPFVACSVTSFIALFLQFWAADVGRIKSKLSSIGRKRAISDSEPDQVEPKGVSTAVNGKYSSQAPPQQPNHAAKYLPRRLNVSGDLDWRSVLLDPTGAWVGSLLLGSCLVVIIVVSFFHVDVWKITLPFAVAKFIYDIGWDWTRFGRFAWRNEPYPSTYRVPGDKAVLEDTLKELEAHRGHAQVDEEGEVIEDDVEDGAQKTNGDASKKVRIMDEKAGSTDALPTPVSLVSPPNPISDDLLPDDGSEDFSRRRAQHERRKATEKTLVGMDSDLAKKIASSSSTPTPESDESASRSTRDVATPPGFIRPISNLFDAVGRFVRRHFPTLHTAFPRLPFALVPFAFSQFILIEALSNQGWIDIFAVWLVRATHHFDLFATIWVVGVLGVILCNISGTNIGATILLTKVVRAAALGSAGQAAAASAISPVNMDAFLRASAIALAVASNIGAVSFTFSASLAGLLWRQILEQKGIHIKQRTFAFWNMLPLLVMTAVGLGVVCAEMAVLY
ncbi:hypothetical protein CVT24_001642 [Panaeolus cyanescens]|uniref:Citrate transporter-like domain-containing protein n=1 Tax=Panaeolus cyanescens TaxID=181874 RepID=A0A409VSX4_9AGAR|nr:hypothetical protein CVT24_001642 [Panaeolus cyanescens]